MKRLMVEILVLVLAALAGVMAALAGPAGAQDSPNPTGTWKWTIRHGLATRELSARLNRQGDQLTGVFVFPNQAQAAIEEGRFKDGEVFFKVSRLGQHGRQVVMRYTGRLSGDTIKGKIEIQHGGPSQFLDWQAKRVKD